MTILKTTALALTLVATALAGAPAYAKGGGGDIAEQKKKLLAELREARAAGANDCATASLFEMMFGHDDDTATTEAAPVSATN